MPDSSLTIGQNVIKLRKAKGFSQEQLAEESNISLRTIQRIEKNNTQPRGHTLLAIAKALDSTLEDLQQTIIAPIPENKFNDEEGLQKLNHINLACLGLIGLPFGNIIFPLLLYRKFKANDELKKAARKIINFQIMWYLVVAPLLIALPLVNQISHLRFPFVLVFAFVAIAYNLYTVIRNTIRIRQGNLAIYQGVPSLF